MKRAARLYRGDEKTGVQKIVRANGHVVDLEIPSLSARKLSKG
jgi:hypothetical protein